MHPDIDTTCAAIRFHHRQRQFAMKQRKRANNALGAFLRLMMGWKPDNDAENNSQAKKQAARLIKIGEYLFANATRSAARQKLIVHGSGFEPFRDLIMAAIHARSPFDRLEIENTKRMEKLAKTLPVWAEWGQSIRGFGPRSLGVIVGEAGNLANYPAKGHLWKRMGLAVIDGVRQGGLRSSAKSDEWMAHGYNPARRSHMFVIGDVLIKSKNPYRDIYLRRKAYECEMAEGMGLIVAPSAKIPANRKDEFISAGHIHAKAQRYMEQKFLRDLHNAWRRQTGCKIATGAGIPKDVWNMDSRAGGITEAWEAGIDEAHVSRAAQHSQIATTKTYDRQREASIAIVAEGRKQARKGNQNGG